MPDAKKPTSSNSRRIGAKDVYIYQRPNTSVWWVHGCFWHRHPDCKKATTPKTRVAFWTEKFERNVARDRLKETTLREMGWQVLVVWECETKAIETLAAKLASAFTPKPYPSDLDGSGDEERGEYP